MNLFKRKMFHPRQYITVGMPGSAEIGQSWLRLGVLRGAREVIAALIAAFDSAKSTSPAQTESTLIFGLDGRHSYEWRGLRSSFEIMFVLSAYNKESWLNQTALFPIRGTHYFHFEKSTILFGDFLLCPTCKVGKNEWYDSAVLFLILPAFKRNPLGQSTIF